MTKRLHTILLFLSVLFVSSLQAQNVVFNGNIVNPNVVVSDISVRSEKKDIHSEKVFSCYLEMHPGAHKNKIQDKLHNLHSNHISLIDIISSDEGADFNCSGGFCMDKSHFHKRGLTLKKQLFGYFIKISC
ncbi:hypothetical protein ACWGOQ_0019370 [Aquimarina sp. M1]